MPYLDARKRIVAIEDDPMLASHLHQHFCRRGFDTVVKLDVEGFLELACADNVDLVLMDIMLPGGNGLELLEALRQRCRVPVILMSALGAEQDRITGFSQGADDYLPKPFSIKELDVRVDALLRRVTYERAQTQRTNPAPDAAQPDTQADHSLADLTPIELRLLQAMQRYPGKVLSKAHLYQHVLHRPYARQDRVLDLHISHVRRKLAAIGWPGRIDTVWGEGYVLLDTAS